jgi:GNAT superfamily N-acetyltransferase
MPDSLTIKVDQDPNGTEIGYIERGLYLYEEARLGSPEHVHFAVLLRDSAGHVQGGVDGHVMWHRLFIKTLWLPETLRGRGYGTALMAVTENEARARGCLGIWLTALGDQPRRFYLRLGYLTIGELRDYIGGQSLYTLEKRFA